MLLNNFIFSLNVVAPVFLLLFVGYFLRRDILDARTAGRLNWIVYNCALPLMLFRDIAGSDFTSVLDSGLIIFAIVSTLIIFLITSLLALKLVKPTETGAFIQGACRGNYAIVGLQIIANILGESQTGKAALITTFVIPLYNVLSVFVLTLNSNEKDKSKGLWDNVRAALMNIVKNPLIIGILAGVPFSVFHIRLPGAIASVVNSLAVLATPLALLSIGASINLSQIRNKFKPAAIASALKLIATPLIFVPIALKMGFTGERLVILYVMFATPTALNSYIMADLMGNDSTLAANIVLITILGSLFTFTIGVFWLRMIGAF
ncbi:MAG: AEC family transporter [Clostridiales bacterium]|jgi:predicted permease|nr:AEC family transporter [Clostridiales bacterium]